MVRSERETDRYDQRGLTFSLTAVLPPDERRSAERDGSTDDVDLHPYESTWRLFVEPMPATHREL